MPDLIPAEHGIFDRHPGTQALEIVLDSSKTSLRARVRHSGLDRDRNNKRAKCAFWINCATTCKA